jgi:vacuolar-type H+-ATPase subunit I/STV1
MARRRDSKDLLTRLADAGEDAIQRLSEVPGGKKVLDAVSGIRDRVDELQHRVRNLGDLEKRVKALEKKVAELSKPKTRRTTARKTTAAKK